MSKLKMRERLYLVAMSVSHLVAADFLIATCRKRWSTVVLASSILGVDDDIRAMADEFAGHGYIAAAPICSSRKMLAAMSIPHSMDGERRSAQDKPWQAGLVD